MLVYDLGKMVTDKASELEGMLTHAQFSEGGEIAYLFQPKGLNPEDGQPVKSMWLIGENRIKGGTKTDLPIPLELIGTVATDKATGFKGKIIHLTLHISGCLHALIQPRGHVKKTGAMIEPCDFDIRRLSGRKIPKLTASQLKKSQKKKPSPAPVPRYIPKI